MDVVEKASGTVRPGDRKSRVDRSAILNYCLEFNYISSEIGLRRNVIDGVELASHPPVPAHAKEDIVAMKPARTALNRRNKSSTVRCLCHISSHKGRVPRSEKAPPGRFERLKGTTAVSGSSDSFQALQGH